MSNQNDDKQKSEQLKAQNLFAKLRKKEALYHDDQNDETRDSRSHTSQSK